MVDVLTGLQMLSEELLLLHHDGKVEDIKIFVYSHKESLVSNILLNLGWISFKFRLWPHAATEMTKRPFVRRHYDWLNGIGAPQAHCCA